MNADEVLFLSYLCLAHALVAAPAVLPIVWLSRKIVRWHWSELAIFVLPFAAWLALMEAGDIPKSLANLGEAFYLSAIIVVAVALRALVARVVDNWLVPALLIAAAMVSAAGVYYTTPVWPEV